MDLGEHYPCLNVKDLERSIEFYKEATARGLKFEKTSRIHPDGSWNATLHDPDGNCIFFNTFPNERDEYVRTGRLIDY